ncbi:CHAT domain-containing protein [Parasphingorhabdus sp.]|uniref:CHAT domain-containing protein n=1 Tax=Parasphingorhabdus sp. TaxID=2709688 RepID=UPI003C763FF1
MHKYCGENIVHRTRNSTLILAFGLLASPVAALAQGTPVSLRDSFPIGSSDGILCQVQDRSIENKAKANMFDRSWAVVCRDSARPVGFVYSSRLPEQNLLDRIAPQRSEPVTCTAETAQAPLGDFRHTECRLSAEPVAYSLFLGQQNGTSYIAEGLAAYDSATLLALKSILNDSIAEGKIDVASTSVEDPFAFARVQAATLKPDQALAEGYRRNLSGDYAEAAAFFETLQQRTSGMEGEDINPDEYLINRALQKSNLGEFAEADNLFEQARDLNGTGPVTERLQRNFEAIHLLNQGRFDAAIKRINVPLKTSLVEQIALTERLEITTPISTRINGSVRTRSLLGFVDELKLSEQERTEIIDAQALQLLGTAQRINGDRNAARNSLVSAYNRAVAVRDGRVTSITRLRAQTLSELALLSEADGRLDEAEQLLRDGLDLLSVQYPETRAVNGAKARLAAFLLRLGQETEARKLYNEVVVSSLGKRSAISGMANQLAPYFKLLAADESATEQFFKASQILVRPGVAETQAVLSRELSGGTDDAARLFRQSTNLARSIERLRIRFSALGQIEQSASVAKQSNDLASEIEALERSQQLTQVRLAEYPQYRAVADRFLGLEELRATLRPSEAYMRMAIIGGDVFMFYTDQTEAKTYRVPLGENALDEKVDTIRASVSVFENGQYVTYPFDIEAARALYSDLFGPVSEQLASKKHLIFEPDGAMLRLPINLLVADDTSVSRYLARLEAPDADFFDFADVKWLGRNIDISTAVSPRAFADARQAPQSGGAMQYLGLGRNEPILANTKIAGIRGGAQNMDANCQWPLSQWNSPISDIELREAQSQVGVENSEIITGAAFTDTGILSKGNISDYRILHFATHGLVTAPSPSCPAKPALLTSFGEEGSDGLLAFDEIFDLKLDADLVILSACDTAGKASIATTRAAGVSSGGGTALDGLVRSFIGAGGRSVLASHWPAPDDFRATERLINGLFSDGRGRSVTGALRHSQLELMDDPLTSHPYYWSGFALIGDGARPLLPSAKDPATNAEATAPATKATLK